MSSTSHAATVRSSGSVGRSNNAKPVPPPHPYQYLVGDSAFHFIVDDGSIEVHDGRARDPAVVVTTDEETFADVASARITASSAVATGALTVAGDPQAAKRLGKIFSRSQLSARAEAIINGDLESRGRI